MLGLFIKKAKQLSGRDWLYLIVAFLLLLFFKICIKTIPIGRLKGFFARLLLLPNSRQQAQEVLAKGLAIQRVAYRFSFLGFSCLPRALAFRFWLRNRPNAEVHFGVQKDALGQFAAHAWVSEGAVRVFGDDPSQNYKSIWVW
jgi:hypothetical protein